jgi:hypothetical protein
MSALATDVGLSHNLVDALLDNFDRLQNVRYLVIAAHLATNDAEAEDHDKYAVAQLLQVIEDELDVMIDATNKANDADIEAFAGTRNKGAADASK